ncbi:MAG: DUF1893 domain-containing protein [Erysipelotrichaceae bacterium]|nr:DUF1893 domain-containing protein [Erysipelotrichaceae bacterium]
MTDMEKARELLTDDKTCVLVKDDRIYSSVRKGIAPLMGFLNEGIDIRGFSIADRIVGKAAASLYVLAGIKEAYGEVMSKAGAARLEEYHIPYTYGTLTERIINRKGDDICPMEKTVQDIDDPQDAYEALKEKIKSLM